MEKITLKKVGVNEWEIAPFGQMKVKAIVFAKEALLEKIEKDLSLTQLIQAASLPGVISPVIGLPDIHEGFGLPIGGVMATNNLVCAGAVGMDINCGVRLLTSPLRYDPKIFTPSLLRSLSSAIQKVIPIGLGSRQKENLPQGLSFEAVITEGVTALAKKGFADKDDLESTEENGCLSGAKIAALSPQAINRARKELGTLGSGNHFMDIQVLDQIFDPHLATQFGLFKNQICVMVHCGSRALGHQTCLDYTRCFIDNQQKYGLKAPTPNLAALPADSPLGQDYLAAMAASVNFAFANRQLITDRIRQVFLRFFKKEKPHLKLLYDVAHNIAKWEIHRGKKLLVHRKGATRCLPASHPQNPEKYRQTGHPAIIPGSMGTSSFVVVGLPPAEKTYFSTNHGAGRLMSRNEAFRTIKKEAFEEIMKEIVYNLPFRKIADEAPGAYKDINLVIQTTVEAGLVQKVARLRPLAVIKGT